MTSPDHIDVTGIEVEGRHGVYPHEKQHAQRFVVDLRLWGDLRRAAAADDLAATVDYVAVAAAAAAVVRDESFDLVETLADRVAARVLAVPGPHDAVTVTVAKPEAAVAAGAARVAVTVHRGRA